MNLFEENKLIVSLAAVFVGLIIATWYIADRKQPNPSVPASAVRLEIPVSAQKKLDVSFNVESALVADSDLKKMYYAKNENEKRAIASLTKIFASVVVLEQYNLADEIIVPSSALAKASAMGDANADLRTGDSFRVFDLLSVMLIDSSNEAAYAIAESWPKGGNTPEEKLGLFVAAMNEVAARAGLKDTSFSDPSGLDDSGSNYSTALDLARFVKWSERYPLISQISRSTGYQFYSLQGYHYSFSSTDKLLGVEQGIVFGKTGFTDGAGQSIVLRVSRDYGDFIVVLLGADDRFADSQELIAKLGEIQ